MMGAKIAQLLKKQPAKPAEPQASEELHALLKTLREVELSTKRKVQETLVGRYRSVFKGRGIDFDQVREYVAGDDVRTIDWNVTARTGRPHVKEHIEERQLTLLLAIDLSGSSNFGSGEKSKRRLAAEIASTLAFSAVESEDRVGLILFSDRIERYIPPGKGRRHVLRVIREILTAKPEGQGTDIAAALDFVGRMSKKRSVLFLISDFLTEQGSRAEQEALGERVRRSAIKHDLVAFQVRDPRETELPKVGRLTLEDPETGELIVVNSARRKVRNKFSELVEARQHTLERMFHRAGVDCVTIETDGDPMTAIGSFFDQRERKLR